VFSWIIYLIILLTLTSYHVWFIDSCRQQYDGMDWCEVVLTASDLGKIGTLLWSWSISSQANSCILLVSNMSSEKRAWDRGNTAYDTHTHAHTHTMQISYLKVRNIPKPLAEKNKEKEAMSLYWSCVQPSVHTYSPT
jgi:hypothetical protein